MQRIKSIFRLKNLFYGALVIIALLIGWYAYTQISGFSKRVTDSWKEIDFAYQHPTMVQTIRVDYASKSAELEDSYKRKDPTVQEKLLDELTKQLQSKK